MKNIIFTLLLISIIIFYTCKDDDSSVTPKTQSGTNTGTETGTSTGTNTGSATGTGTSTSTSYVVKNSCTFVLYNVCSYYYDGSDIQDFVNHGTMTIGSITSKVYTNRSMINLGLTIGSQTCIITDDYYITSNQNNTLIISDSTHVYCSKGIAKQTINEAYNYN